MGLPCEECIVYAICRARHSAVEATIECEDVWNYVIEETNGPVHDPMKVWLASKEFQVRSKRMNRLREMFPNCKSLEWGGDKF